MSLEELKKAINLTTKLHCINLNADPLEVDFIRGINKTTKDCDVTVDRVLIPKTSEAIDYLSSSEVQAKIFNPKKRGIILLDIVGYSRFDTFGQAAFLTILKDTLTNAFASQAIFSTATPIKQFVPTGDGCYIVFDEAFNDRFIRAVCGIKSELFCHQVRLLRETGQAIPPASSLVQAYMGCHLGEVDFFVDISGNMNCYGTGMNETARILDLGKREIAAREQNVEGTAFIGEELLTQAKELEKPPIKISVEDIGTHKDKHGFEFHIFWIKDIPNHATIAFDSSQTGISQPIFKRC